MSDLIMAIEQRYQHNDESEFCIKCDILELVREVYND